MPSRAVRDVNIDGILPETDDRVGDGLRAWRGPNCPNLVIDLHGIECVKALALRVLSEARDRYFRPRPPKRPQGILKVVARDSYEKRYRPAVGRHNNLVSALVDALQTGPGLVRNSRMLTNSTGAS